MNGSGRVLIIGGGASGVLLAARLLRRPGGRCRVALIETRDAIGRGIAYSTDDPDHILNTRAASMSAFAEDPEHFWRWLGDRGHVGLPGCPDPFCFVPRDLYGRYLEDLLTPYRVGSGDGRLEIVTGECTDLRATGTGVAAHLADGRRLMGHAAVLATGHDMPGVSKGGVFADAWRSPAENGIGRQDTVLILGTGLTMVDTVIRLLNAGHEGRILAVSRRGKLPQPHRRNRPLPIDAADIPFGTEISYLARWLRRTAAWAEAQGGDWREVIDGIRPHTAALWGSLTPDARRRFLRHARTWWDIHRHRIPEESLRRITAARASGQLEVMAGRFLDATPDGTGALARIRPRGSNEALELPAHRIIACTGVLHGDAPFRSALLSALEKGGAIRQDALGLGLDVDAAGAVVGATGKAAARIFALGPVTVARFWEVTAVPDIRLQAAALADRIGAVLAQPAIAPAPSAGLVPVSSDAAGS